MRIFNCFVHVFLVFSFFSFAKASKEKRFRAKVIDVTDGDSFVAVIKGRRVRIRLFGVDTPESFQPFGREAAKWTRGALLGKQIVFERKTIDRYQRIVALVWVGDLFVNQELLQRGLAWHYKRYSPSKKWAALAEKARKAKIGLWTNPNAISPWLWRQKNRRSKPFFSRKGKIFSTKPTKDRFNSQSFRKGFHGNIRSRIVHAKGCRQFQCRHCTRYFPTRLSVKKAGFRFHSKCTNTK